MLLQQQQVLAMAQQHAAGVGTLAAGGPAAVCMPALQLYRQWQVVLWGSCSSWLCHGAACWTLKACSREVGVVTRRHVVGGHVQGE